MPVLGEASEGRADAPEGAVEAPASSCRIKSQISRALDLALPRLTDDTFLLDAREVPVLVEVRRHNPLLFDFVLKRRLGWQGKRFGARVFETQRFFERPGVAGLTTSTGPASIAGGGSSG